MNAPLAASTAVQDDRPSLVGLSRARLAERVAELGLPAFRARQIFHWIYHHGVTDFERMTTLAGPLRKALAERYTLARPAISTEQTSVDGTRKWLLRLADRREVEAVYIPEENRGALCVSSQVGCTLTCKFCHTGTQKLVRNLSAPEIVSQMMVARDSYGEWPSRQEDRRITNIVLMGMGEPLYNYDAVAEALGVMMDGEGIGLSRRRITLSTSGVVPGIVRCGRELRVNLAISLHAVRDDLRDEIVPINRKWPIAELLDACRDYAGANPSRRITFEYVMLKGVNDSEAEAKELVRLISGLPAKVNLIPFNPWPGAPYECSDDATIERFAAVVMRAGYASPVRRPRGRDILAACGQLKSASERERRVRAAAAQPAA